MSKKIFGAGLLCLACLVFVYGAVINVGEDIVPQKVDVAPIVPVEPEPAPSIVPTSLHSTIIVEGKSYPIALPQGATVYDAMAHLASTTAFPFKATYHSGLGHFFQEIKGIKNNQGFYWTLYINGAYSLVGASQYILKDNDTVEWKYEKK